MKEKLIRLIRLALKNHVTDIHFNEVDEKVNIEMRINGIIKTLKTNSDNKDFFRYLQYCANLDVGNILAPQTGRFEIEIEDKVISLRFALIKSYMLTSGVLRILNNHTNISIKMLTTNPNQIHFLENIGNHRSGLYVFSGPTGSGKTTTLYTILSEIKGKKIFTLEDPIEIYNDSYVQLQINEGQHFGYAEGIKQLMRHDPDIIMIGEIRDSEAAKMAIRCALTGHLVVTSIHSSSCLSAVQRLIELGVSKTQLYDVLQGVSNQRLYTYGENAKIGVYEIMDRKEIEYYYANQALSTSYTFLRQNIYEAIKKGQINPQEAMQDIE